jgi:hypothetical protein
MANNERNAGRKAKAKDERRDKVISIPVTKEQYAFFSEKAASEGLDLGAFARSTLIKTVK